ncbi:hypothetical protein HPB47_008529 [Ixodes persulcatus]|uniref:Uncharacterized protein n=1 Tax=Ixodes persulcatus TaxID=34615 RepID=A0AC60P4V6_IXOPE|nr:hypothetical protein HPB47_008529 [Ixodes persulcatus]
MARRRLVGPSAAGASGAVASSSPLSKPVLVKGHASGSVARTFFCPVSTSSLGHGNAPAVAGSTPTAVIKSEPPTAKANNKGDRVFIYGLDIGSGVYIYCGFRRQTWPPTQIRHSLLKRRLLGIVLDVVIKVVLEVMLEAVLDVVPAASS